jgi:hypothetical protein
MKTRINWKKVWQEYIAGCRKQNLTLERVKSNPRCRLLQRIVNSQVRALLKPQKQVRR